MKDMNSCVLNLKNVSKNFGDDKQQTRALQQVSLNVYRGELVVILGPSGSGKTTLLSVLSGLIKQTSGEINIFGRSISDYSLSEMQYLRSEKIGFIFQNFLLIDCLTVKENIEIVLGFAKKSRKEAIRKTGELLNYLKIEHLADKFPKNLSNGEKQRVAIARAIANENEIIFADEPTGSLESAQGFEIIKLLHSLANRQNKCVIISTHDLRMTEIADRIIRLEDGKIISQKFQGGKNVRT